MVVTPCGSFSDTPAVWTAQAGQDKYVVQNLINVDRCSSGLFVEFGARDGWRESNLLTSLRRALVGVGCCSRQIHGR